ncbi:hypothetical protein [Pseudomonas sp. KCJK9016]|uniref:hypothetical protein n=1 Tax=Pseudomonas sp. KCJK9016 TaxID=3344556 RepID=UPI003906476A
MQTIDSLGFNLALEVGDTITFQTATNIYEDVKLVGLDRKAGAFIVQGTSTGNRPRAFSVKECTFLLPADFTSPSSLRPVDVLVLG